MMSTVMSFIPSSKETTMHYAQERNKIFENTKENTFSSISDRIEYVYNLNESNQRLRNVIDDALLDFEFSYPDEADPKLFWPKFDGLAQTALMSDIIIHMKLQRIPTMEAIANYIQNYRWYKAQPIKVFTWIDPDSGKEYMVCWDGQHTLIMFYLIGTVVHKLNPNQITLPVNIRRNITIEQAREALMSENGEGRELFDSIDMHEQYVHAVRDTGSTNKNHMLSERKQTYLEDNMMFLANPRRGEMDKPGALTRINEILNPEYPEVVTKHFAEWCFGLNGSDRAFGGTEVDCMYYFFNKCVDSGMEIDRRYIKQVAMVCRKVDQNGNDFDGNVFWNKVKSVYETYFRHTQESLEEHEKTRISHEGAKNEKMLTFLCAMLEDAGVEVPDYNPYFPVKKEDLF